MARAYAPEKQTMYTPSSVSPSVGFVCEIAMTAAMYLPPAAELGGGRVEWA